MCRVLAFINETYEYKCVPLKSMQVYNKHKNEYENQTTCEFTNLEENIKPSTLGIIYPLHKSKEMNRTSCWKFLYFTNQVITKLSSESSDKNILFQLIDLSSYSTERTFFLSSKKHSCTDQFLSYSYLDGFEGNTIDGDYLWIDYLIEFTSENNCLEIWPGCLNGNVMFDIPDRKIAYSQVVIAGEVIVVNAFAIYLFIHKDNRTPVTIILSALAVSDTITAILMALPVFIVYQQDYHHITYMDAVLLIYMFTYPQCAVYGTGLDVKYLFHFISVLMTLVLCLQKTVALLFPICNRRYLSSKMSALTCLFILIFSITLFSPIINLVFYFEDVSGS
ncbi:unnamed protein product [Mytilus coruscus]|uniref:G-protein coupled receptors family 1 profile domain-containing protein n=1 Tax=Mytilus coruscus TaxID=42192 RepID=A0A6J8AAF5_MYTCO|nr:unnamed protein product [Mytilus coruscus]